MRGTSSEIGSHGKILGSFWNEDQIHHTIWVRDPVQPQILHVLQSYRVSPLNQTSLHPIAPSLFENKKQKNERNKTGGTIWDKTYKTLGLYNLYQKKGPRRMKLLSRAWASCPLQINPCWIKLSPARHDNINVLWYADATGLHWELKSTA